MFAKIFTCGRKAEKDQKFGSGGIFASLVALRVVVEASWKPSRRLKFGRYH